MNHAKKALDVVLNFCAVAGVMVLMYYCFKADERNHIAAQQRTERSANR